MATPDILVDETGLVWQTHSPALVDRHHARRAKANFPEYLVRNLGYIRVRLRPKRRSAQVAFRSSAVTAQSILSVADFLLKNPADQYIVQRVHDNPTLIHVEAVEDVVSVLVDQTDNEFRRPRFFNQNLSLERIAQHGPKSVFHPLLDAWIKSSGDLDTARASGIKFDDADRKYLSRNVGGYPEFHEIGSGFTALRSVAVSAKNIAIDDLPDREYGAWVSDSLLATEYFRLPKYELMEATVRIPGEAPFRSRYERLLLPWKAKGEIFVSSISHPRAIF